MGEFTQFVKRKPQYHSAAALAGQLSANLQEAKRVGRIFLNREAPPSAGNHLDASLHDDAAAWRGTAWRCVATRACLPLLRSRLCLLSGHQLADLHKTHP